MDEFVTQEVLSDGPIIHLGQQSSILYCCERTLQPMSFGSAAHSCFEKAFAPSTLFSPNPWRAERCSGADTKASPPSQVTEFPSTVLVLLRLAFSFSGQQQCCSACVVLCAGRQRCYLLLHSSNGLVVKHATCKHTRLST